MLDKRISENYISGRGATCAHRNPLGAVQAGFFFVRKPSLSRTYPSLEASSRRLASAESGQSAFLLSNNPAISQRITSPALAQDAVT